jgi:drug/metabolite transporter (DMT)-like permease
LDLNPLCGFWGSLYSILFSLLLGITIFKEKLTAQKSLSVLLVLSGFYFFIQPNGLKNIDLGMVFGIVAGLFDTISNAFRKHLAGKLDRVVLTLVPQIGGILVATILMVMFGGLALPVISTTNWFVGLLFGSMIFMINYLTLYGFQHFDLNLGTIAISTEVVFATLFGWLVFAEVPRSLDIYGGLFIVLAIIIGNWPAKSKISG